MSRRLRAVRAALAGLGAAAALLAAAPAAAEHELGTSRLRDVSLVLQRMCEVQAVSSHETPLTRRIQSLLPQGLRSQVDGHGNLVVELGAGDPVVTFVAHQDEIGYEIKGLEADGRATVVRRGGFYDWLLEGHPVVVGTAAGPVPAVVAPRPGYLDAKPDREGVAPEDLRLDFGTDSWAATGALGVKAGDPVTVVKRYDRLGAVRASARSMDDRCGCAALLLALQDLEGSRLSHRVRFVFSTEEELGLYGAEFAARAVPGAVCFAVDTFVSSDSPLENPRFALAPLGEGCVVRAIDSSSIVRRADLERVRQLAREAHVPLQVGLTAGGNDGARYVTEGAGDVPLGWPLRSSHSNSETVDLRDVSGLADLITELARRW
ncbi:MAG TPA: M20/M25/M40 family metallo-hydrolase [Candidatus Saccharimonadales bacterium]|nr:M20/M25/M40 family metallo-hydrolase [Candidatus Saccharimonadales bacterium]